MASFPIIMFMSVALLVVLLPLQAHGATVAFTYCNTEVALKMPVNNVDVSLGVNGMPVNITIEFSAVLPDANLSSGVALLTIDISRGRDHNLKNYKDYVEWAHGVQINVMTAFQNIDEISEDDLTVEITMELLGTQLMCIRFLYSLQ